MKKITPVMLGIGLLVVCGCAGPKSEFVPPRGALYTNFQAPLLVHYDQATVSATEGEASTSYIYEPFITGLSYVWGDCTPYTAAQEKGIKKVGTADYEFLSVLGIYARTTVHVNDGALLAK
jgi:hypothetical protein